MEYLWRGSEEKTKKSNGKEEEEKGNNKRRGRKHTHGVKGINKVRGSNSRFPENGGPTRGAPEKRSMGLVGNCCFENHKRSLNRCPHRAKGKKPGPETKGGFLAQGSKKPFNYVQPHQKTTSAKW